MKNSESLEILSRDFPSIETPNILSAELQQQRQALLEKAKIGITLPFKTAEGEISVTFKSSRTEQLDIYGEDKKIGHISIVDLTESTRTKHGVSMRKRIKDEFQNLGIVSVGTSIFFEILLGQGYVTARGDVKNENIASLKARSNVQVLLGPNKGGSYETISENSQDSKNTYLTTLLISQVGKSQTPVSHS